MNVCCISPVISQVVIQEWDHSQRMEMFLWCVQIIAMQRSTSYSSLLWLPRACIKAFPLFLPHTLFHFQALFPLPPVPFSFALLAQSSLLPSPLLCSEQFVTIYTSVGEAVITFTVSPRTTPPVSCRRVVDYKVRGGRGVFLVHNILLLWQSLL